MSNVGLVLGQNIDNATRNLVETARRSVVAVVSENGHGAGIVWNAAHTIVTNAHVVSRCRDVLVEAGDGRRLRARVTARDAENDLALLTIHGLNLPPVSRGDARLMRVGEIVLAVGHPHGIRDTATLGILSGQGRGTWMGRADREVVQADLALAPGNSGGPLLDAHGTVIGIAAMILSPGIAVAIPSHVAEAFVRAAHAPLRMAA